MSDPPESVVRRFFAAWADPKPDELGSFFHEDAVWVDGPHPSSVATHLRGSMAVFELDADGRITQWREAYALKSMMDQIKAAARTRHWGKPKS
jgi:hypothetical protein